MLDIFLTKLYPRGNNNNKYQYTLTSSIGYVPDDPMSSVTVTLHRRILPSSRSPTGRGLFFHKGNVSSNMVLTPSEVLPKHEVM